MELEKLIFANKHIKRNLNSNFRGKDFRFKDGRGKIVKAEPMGLPHVIMVSTVENAYPTTFPQRNKTPYSINLNVTRDEMVDGLITEYEAAIILGVDMEEGITQPVDIHAMIEACTGGPGYSNAYVYGGSTTFGEIRRPPTGSFVVIPIQYYRISQKDYDSLALTEREIKKIKNNL